MQFETLRVHHESKREFPYFSQLAALRVPGLLIETCQRRIFISSHPDSLPGFSGQLYADAQAYAFLLRFATGLESEIKGETDVFGQFKRAWTAYEKSRPFEATRLQYWIQKIFEDAKEIRSRYLQNVGQGTYGSLTRKLIRQRSVDAAREPILLVGAGKLASSIAPWLLDHELWIANRSQSSAEALVAQLEALPRNKITQPIRILSTREEEQNGWAKASHAVLCIPLDPQEDQDRLAWWNLGADQASGPRTLVHLAAYREHSAPWKSCPEFHSLDELFALQRTQGSQRSHLIETAERGCLEKAQLRFLSALAGASLSLPHGWEDLASFG